MNTGKPYHKNINNFNNEKLIKVSSEDITKQQDNKNTTKNPYYYYGFVNEITYLEVQLDLYLSKIYSQLSLQAIEFYSEICEQTYANLH